MRSAIQRQAKFLAMLLGLIVLAGCGSAGSGGSAKVSAPTATLTATPTTFTAGQGHSTLSFTSTNADSGVIDNGEGAVGLNGQITVSPTVTTTYTYTASGPGGSASAKATVTVTAPPPPTATLTANPTTITAQGFSTLTYSSTNADSASIDNGEGQVGLNGHVNVSPTVTTTYTYTATGPGGSASAQATVTVTPPPPPPTITLTVTPATIFPNQSFTLAWQSTNATTSVVIEPKPGAVTASGSKTLTVAQTTTYTAVATGNNQQATATATVTVSPVTSFDGLLPDSSNNTDTKIDPNGAVGTKQFMEYVNTEYQAFDKITHQPVLPPSTKMFGQAIGTPWTTPLNSAPIPACETTGIALDAVINFDRLASRWVIAGKAVRQSGTSEEYYLCIAVSNTDDASASNFGWYAYAFSLNTTLATGSQYYFPDWPKLGTWPDAYYATMDMLDPNGNDTENGVAVCALDRTDMLTGGTAKNPQCFADTSRVGNNGLYLAHSLIPADFDGTTPPPVGRDEFLVSIENPLNDGMTTTSASFNLWDFHVDWSNSANSTLTVTPISVAPYTPGCYLPSSPAITNCVNEPQSGGQGQHIDSVGDRFMPRFAYRNFGSYESFLVSHTVKTGADAINNPNQTGINWYELRGSGTPSLFQSGTINPDNSLFRFLPSIAQDKVGNVAIGYSVSNSFNYPGIDFSYWNLGTATPPAEVSILSGNGEEVTPTTGTGNWGTYSSMTVDPNPTDDCTFWYVNEYWPTNAAWATRIAYFKIPTCVP